MTDLFLTKLIDPLGVSSIKSKVPYNIQYSKFNLMAIAPILKKAYWASAFAGGLYFAFLSLLLNGWVQRQ